MPIQFPCTGCGNQLSVPEGTAGRKARCPKCSTVVDIPADSPATAGEASNEQDPAMRPPAEQPAPSFSEPASPAGGFAPSAPKPASDNPYASPTMGYDEPTQQAAKGKIQPTIIDFGDVFQHTWNIYTKNVWVVLLTADSVWLISTLASYVLQIMILAISESSEEAGLAVSVGGQFVLFLLNTFLGIGQTIILLDFARGRPFAFERFFDGIGHMIWIIFALIGLFIMIGLGCVLFIIPGIWLALMFSQVYYLMIDQRLGIVEAFETSQQITYGNKWTILGIGLIVGMVVAGSCFLLCLPFLFFMPYAALVYIVMYLKMTGQQIATA